MKPVVQLYVTEGCSLCAEVKAMLTSLRAKSPFELEETLLTPDHPKYRQFASSVPVIVVNGEHEFISPIDPKEVRRLLTRGTHRDPVYAIGSIMRWIGLIAAIMGVVLRLIGEAYLGYGVFAGALVVFGIGRFLIRGRRGELTSPNLNVPIARETK